MRAMTFVKQIIFNALIFKKPNLYLSLFSKFLIKISKI